MAFWALLGTSVGLVLGAGVGVGKAPSTVPVPRMGIIVPGTPVNSESLLTALTIVSVRFL